MMPLAHPHQHAHEQAPPSWLPRLTLKALILGSMQVLCGLCLLVQAWLDGSTDNMLSTFLVCGSTMLMVQYMSRSAALHQQPLSSFALLGFNASSVFVAMVVQTLDGKPLVESLRAPVLTFGILAVAHVTAIAAHFTYRNFTPLNNTSRALARHVYAPLKIHRIPMPLAIWLLTGLGLVSFAAGGGAIGDAGGKFIAAFAFLIWTPFLIPLFHNIVGPSYGDLRKQTVFIVLYGVLIIGLALVKNYRAMIFAAPVQIIFVYTMYNFWNPQILSARFLKRFGAAAILSALLLPQMSDMVTAMELARANRDKASATEMLQQTLDTFADKTRLRQYRDTGGPSRMMEQYDEQYLANPMMARFTETKFHDNMLYFASNLTEEARQDLIDNQLTRMVAIVPTNVLEWLDIKIDKNNMVYSNGDYYLNVALGGHLGGYATGSIWADLYVMFGAWFPLIAFAMLTVVFILMDALAQFGPGLFISAATLCDTWHLFLYGVGGESIVNKVNQLTRGSIQPVLVYAAALLACGLVLHVFRQPMFAPSGSAAKP